ncbi:MAG: sensor histidine kinase, partial [Candidatus Hodarchaeales archaeon]
DIKIFDIYAEESKSRARLLFGLFKQGIAIKNEELTYQRKDGRKVYGLLSVNPALDEQGNVVASRSVIRDITNEKLMEIKYQKIIQTAADGFCMCDLDGKLLEVNNSYCKMIGYTPEELREMHISDLDAIANTEETALHIEKLKKQGYLRFQTQHNHKNSKIIDVEVSANYYDSEEGKIFIFIRDITEYKNLIEQISESENRYRTLIELGTNGAVAVVMLQDIDYEEGIQVFVSDQWSCIIGYNRKELIGTPFFNLVSPSDREVSKIRHRDKMSGKSIPGLFEVYITRKDGTEILVELSSSSTIFKGKPANVVYLREITERKQLEELLVKERDLAQLYLDVAGVMIIAIDTNQKVTMINRRGCQILGYTVDEAIGRDCVDLYVAKDHRFEVREILSNMMSGKIGPRDYHENSIVTKSGEARMISWHTCIIKDTKGNTVGALGSGEDITELRKALDELKKYQNQLEEQVKVKTDALKQQIDRRIMYARALVHELKTPLTPLIASSDLLCTKLHDRSLLKLAKNVNAGAIRLSKRIDELLDFARSEMGTLNLKYRKVQLNKLICDIYSYIEPEALLHNISLEMKLNNNLPLIICDKDRIQQVLLNLLDNAIKFTPKGGKINISAQQKDSGLLVKVEDNGCGIAKKDHEHLFQPYWYLESKTASYSGLGLGLPLSKMIIERHGGEIWVQSRKGKGSTFSFCLPLNN